MHQTVRMTSMVWRVTCILIIAVFISGCSYNRLQEPALSQMNAGKKVEIHFDEETNVYSTEIDVLIYNVAALPWPIRSNRTRSLKLIGKELAQMRQNGTEPDIVLLQEAFRRSTKFLIDSSGYTNWVRGPLAGDRTPDYSERAPENFKKARSFWNGEKFGKVMDSGLYILTDFPILGKTATPFFRYECAGFDCGANKGMLGAGIEIPGMPGFLQLFTIHLNSGTEASGVSEERSLTAHKLQLDHLNETLNEQIDQSQPLIFGGDFNVKQARDRFDYVTSDRGQLANIKLVQHFCTVESSKCIVDLPYGGDEPWLQTQDWQGWLSGERVHIEAISVKAVFHEERDNAPRIKGKRTLSDHDGLLVNYRLSWR